ncbi:ATP-binding protein [Azohydromonas caseinilytica]|uniref:Sensory/regulatory protein RpfC n=1 Tax=Azohydromonas caseinilytica TaxID=2728836 RepID=A0A848F679_9BURK|nr:ATP-binding protein [Azohydromonas caseinilytica]NML14069.1 response regulator [Azohydromonas caseinilytica]
MNTPARSNVRARLLRWLAVALAALAGVGVIQWQQVERLHRLAEYQDDYLLLGLQQLHSDYLELRSLWRAPPGPARDGDSLQQRYEAFVGRVGLLEGEQAQRLMEHSPELERSARVLRDFVERADLYLGAQPKARLSEESHRALQQELEALDEPIRILSRDSAQQVAAQIAQRHALVAEHVRVDLALTLLLAGGALALALGLLRQRQKLDQRSAGVELLAQRLREARQESEAASQAKSAFLANMSHEIRTPFQGLLGMLALLRDTPLEPRQQEYLRTAGEAADHLLSILNDILDMSKLEAGTLALLSEPVALRPLVADVEAVMRPRAMAKGLALRVHVAPELPSALEIDGTRLKQVLTKLMNNAIQFTDSGSVTLNVRLGNVSGTFECAVTDTGIGMDEYTLSRLFQRFVQTGGPRRHGGTGLGLEISRHLARLMGGDLLVQSSPGAGSSFTLVLPLVEAQEPALPEAEERTLVAGLRVLVAEDHEINRRYLGALLDRLGHRARIVRNGVDAVQAVAEQRFDLVLMDLHMPVLDGAGATQAIRALPAPAGQVPIVALTADALPETRQRCLNAGMNDVLTKPVTLQQLAQVMRRQARTRQPQGAAAESAATPAAAAAAADPVLVDEATATGVAQVLSAPHYRSLVQRYLDDLGVQIPELSQKLHALQDALAADEATASGAPEADAAATDAVRAQEPALRSELREAAHAAKGAALNLGLPGLAQAAVEVEKNASTAEPAALIAALQRWSALLPATRQALQQCGLLQDETV